MPTDSGTIDKAGLKKSFERLAHFTRSRNKNPRQPKSNAMDRFHTTVSEANILDSDPSAASLKKLKTNNNGSKTSLHSAGSDDNHKTRTRKVSITVHTEPNTPQTSAATLPPNEVTASQISEACLDAAEHAEDEISEFSQISTQASEPTEVTEETERAECKTPTPQPNATLDTTQTTPKATRRIGTPIKSEPATPRKFEYHAAVQSFREWTEIIPDDFIPRNSELKEIQDNEIRNLTNLHTAVMNRLTSDKTVEDHQATHDFAVHIKGIADRFIDTLTEAIETSRTALGIRCTPITEPTSHANRPAALRDPESDGEVTDSDDDYDYEDDRDEMEIDTSQPPADIGGAAPTPAVLPDGVYNGNGDLVTIRNPQIAAWGSLDHTTNSWGGYASPPEMPDPTSDPGDPLQRILSLMQEMKNDNRAINERLDRLESGQPAPPVRPTQAPAHPPTRPRANPPAPQPVVANTPAAPTTNTPPVPDAPKAGSSSKTWASITKSNPPPTNTATQPKTITQTLQTAATIQPGTNPANIKYIVKFTHMPLDQPAPQILIPKMRTALQQSTRTLGNGRVVFTKWSDKGNLTIEFSANSTHAIIKEAIPIMMGALKTTNFTVEPLEPTTRIVITNVPTGMYNTSSYPYYKDTITTMVREAINDVYPAKNLKFFLQPDWITNPQRIQDECRTASAIAFSIVDPGKTISTKLLERPRLIIDGNVCIMKPFVSKPTLAACINCARYGHLADVCRSRLRCNKCGKPHATADHKPSLCPGCSKGGKNNDNGTCECVWCPSCSKIGHAFNTEACPKTKEFRRPVTEILTRGAPTA